MCVCVCVLWDKDPGALWVDIAEDAQGGIMGVMVLGGEETLCGARKHTCDPLLARSSTHIFRSPSFGSAAR